MTKNLVFNHNKKLFLGILNEDSDSIIGFKQIQYSENFSMLKNDEICLVYIEDKNSQIFITPLQSIKISDEDGESVIMGMLSEDNLLESANNIFKDFNNIFKSSTIH